MPSALKVFGASGSRSRARDGQLDPAGLQRLHVLGRGAARGLERLDAHHDVRRGKRQLLASLFPAAAHEVLELRGERAARGARLLVGPLENGALGRPVHRLNRAVGREGDLDGARAAPRNRHGALHRPREGPARGLEVRPRVRAQPAVGPLELRREVRARLEDESRFRRASLPRRASRRARTRPRSSGAAGPRATRAGRRKLPQDPPPGGRSPRRARRAGGARSRPGAGRRERLPRRHLEHPVDRLLRLERGRPPAPRSAARGRRGTRRASRACCASCAGTCCRSSPRPAAPG